jgi:hypothetical protein
MIIGKEHFTLFREALDIKRSISLTIYRFSRRRSVFISFNQLYICQQGRSILKLKEHLIISKDCTILGPVFLLDNICDSVNEGI